MVTRIRTHSSIRRTLTSILGMAIASVPFTVGPAFAQSTDSRLPDVLDVIYDGELDADVDPQMIEYVSDLLEEPLDLKTASSSSIAQLPTVDPQTATCIRRYVQEIDTTTWRAIQNHCSPGYRSMLILKNLATLDRGDKPDAPDFSIDVRSRIGRQLQLPRGNRKRIVHATESEAPDGSTVVDTTYDGTPYRGSPWEGLGRLTIGSGSWSAGMTSESDAGEPLDDLFASGYVRFDQNPVEVIAGDFRINWGQGLVIGNRFSGRKGSSPVRDPVNGGQGVRPHRSTSECCYFRGISARLDPVSIVNSEHGGPRVTVGPEVFWSSRNLDATTTVHAGESGDSIRSYTAIDQSGNRRTHSEARKANNVHESAVGAMVDVRFSSLRLYSAGLHVNRSIRAPESAHVSNVPPNRSTSLAAGLHLDVSSATAFGEIASAGTSFATVAGITTGWDKTKLTVAGRYYGAESVSPFSVGFGESPVEPSGEVGAYLGLRSRVAQGLYLSGYVDVYRENGSLTQSVTPAIGHELMVRAAWSASDAVDLNARVRWELSSESVPSRYRPSEPSRDAAKRQLSQARLTATVKPPEEERLRVRARTEFKFASFDHTVPSSVGVLGSVAAQWRAHSDWRLSGGLSYFLAESNDVRLYAAESDVPGRFSIRSFGGRGRRFYCIASYDLSNVASLSLRFAETWYSDRDTIAEKTLEEIDGSTRSDLTLQVDMQI